MAKSQSYRRRKKRQDVRKWLPWGIAGAVILLIGIIAGRALLAPTSPGDGPRAEEWLAGVTGQSYDAGPTDYEYPDPAGLGDGRIWLPALGSVDAPVTVIEFSDIFCGHCRDYNLNALPDILMDYVATGEVRYVNHFFGFAQTVQDGVVMAEMCAAEQGRYFEFRHALFQSVEIGDFDIDRAARIAGVETDRFEACRSEQRYADAMQEIVFMQNRGVSATPTFFVNDQPVAGNRPDEIRRLINEALAAAE